MSVELDIHGDFSTILDGAEPVTLKRANRSDTIAVPQAWRFSSDSQRMAFGTGEVLRNDVVWQFEWDEEVEKPRVGDSIFDGSKECWRILSVEQLGFRTRLRCWTRNLHVVCGLTELVTVQRATWVDLLGEPQIVSWTTVRQGVAARIELDHVVPEADEVPPYSIATYRVMLGESLELDINTRLVDSRGVAYSFVEYTAADGLDRLPIVTVSRVLPAESYAP